MTDAPKPPSKTESWAFLHEILSLFFEENEEINFGASRDADRLIAAKFAALRARSSEAAEKGALWCYRAGDLCWQKCANPNNCPNRLQPHIWHVGMPAKGYPPAAASSAPKDATPAVEADASAKRKDARLTDPTTDRTVSGTDLPGAQRANREIPKLAPSAQETKAAGAGERCELCGMKIGPFGHEIEDPSPTREAKEKWGTSDLCPIPHHNHLGSCSPNPSPAREAKEHTPLCILPSEHDGSCVPPVRHETDCEERTKGGACICTRPQQTEAGAHFSYALEMARKAWCDKICSQGDAVVAAFGPTVHDDVCKALRPTPPASDAQEERCAHIFNDGMFVTCDVPLSRHSGEAHTFKPPRT